MSRKNRVRMAIDDLNKVLEEYELPDEVRGLITRARNRLLDENDSRPWLRFVFAGRSPLKLLGFFFGFISAAAGLITIAVWLSS